MKDLKHKWILRACFKKCYFSKFWNHTYAFLSVQWDVERNPSDTQVAENGQQSSQLGIASMDLGYLKGWLVLSSAEEKKKKLALGCMKI